MRSVQLDGFAWVMSLIAAKQYSISCAGGIGLLVHCSHVPFIVRSGGIHGRRGLNDDLITDARCHVENRPSPILSCFNCRNMNMDERAWTSLAGDPKVREHSFRSGRPANDGREHSFRSGRPANDGCEHSFRIGRSANDGREHSFRRGRPANDGCEHRFRTGRPANDGYLHSFRSGRPANDGREHCDRGNQYGCSAFRQRLGADGMEQTMSARANPNPINPRSALASTD